MQTDWFIKKIKKLFSFSVDPFNTITILKKGVCKNIWILQNTEGEQSKIQINFTKLTYGGTKENHNHYQWPARSALQYSRYSFPMSIHHEIKVSFIDSYWKWYRDCIVSAPK